MPQIGVLIQPGLREELFDTATFEALSQWGTVVTFDEKRRPTADDARQVLRQAEICIGSWGMPRLTDELLADLPQLRLVVYCAGSVKAFATDAMWDRGIRVTSGAPSIAVGVAEYVVGLAIMARRNAFALDAGKGRSVRKDNFAIRELWGATVGIVSLGQVGRKVAEYMRPFGVELLAYDPYASPIPGVERVDLCTLLKRADIVTLHAPKLPSTRHMIDREELRLMKDGAVLINTARGSLINEEALIEELRTGRIYACLDVTDPEPAAPDSPLRTLPNVFLTPHIAGPRTRRLGLQALEEVRRYCTCQPQVYEMTKSRLEITA